MIMLPNGAVAVTTTRCRRCLSDRIWECLFNKELYCMNCEPPSQVIPKVLAEKKLAAAVKAAQAQKLDDEMEDDNERLLYTQRTGKTS